MIPMCSIDGKIVWIYGMEDIPTIETTINAYFKKTISWGYSANPFWTLGYKSADTEYKAALVDLLKVLKFN